jgi:alpha-tubulin suppressor-like RCC1 family protein
MRHRMSVVAFGLVAVLGLAGSAGADVPRGSDSGRRPSGTRIAGSRDSFTATGACSVAGNGTVHCWGAQRRITLASADVPFSDPVQITGVSSAVAVSVGRLSACALRSDGKVLCWGDNFSLQLGREPRTLDTLPAAEVPNLSDVVQIAVGSFHVCAVTVRSSVLCWGGNSSSQLAQEGVAMSATPVQVPGVSALSLSAAAFHTCALRNNGTVACWGGNDSGQAHPESFAVTLTEPREVSVAGIVDISAGATHTCAVVADGTVTCWGRNIERQIDRSVISAREFRVVPGVTNVVSVAALTAATCALIADGTIRCWGANQGALVQPAVTGAVDIASACALIADGSTTCFGIASPSVTSRDDPYSTKARSIALGDNHSCARRLNGSLACWGENSLGQLGDGTATDRPTPVPVLDNTQSVVGASVAAGAAHGCMRTASGGAQCWGDNAFGQLGDLKGGGVRDTLTVIDHGFTPLANVVAVTNGTRHSCALLANGTAKCWGSNADGQLGDGTRTTPSSPVNAVLVKRTENDTLQNIRALAAGGRHTCALLADGTARCWGANEAGQSDGNPGGEVLKPTAVTGGVVIATGAQHTCVLSTSGGATCWGENGSGQLGPVGTGGQHTFAAAAVGIAAGAEHSCVVKANGSLACWGANGSGQLGNNSTTNSTSSVTVRELVTTQCPDLGTLCTMTRPLERMIAIDAGGAHSCAIRVDGQPFCWGSDSSGQLGDNSLISNKSTARPVTNFY